MLKYVKKCKYCCLLFWSSINYNGYHMALHMGAHVEKEKEREKEEYSRVNKVIKRAMCNFVFFSMEKVN